MLWLAVHFPQLHLDSVTQVVDSDEREGSQLSERACLIVDGKQQVCQRNCAAELQGIELGMKLGTASALVDDLFFFELDEGLEHRKLKELAGLCYGLSADVVIRNEYACLLIEFSSMLKLYGSSQRYIKAFTALLNQQRIRYRLGLASSPLLAEFLARFLKMEPSELNAAYAVGLLAKLPVCCLDLPDAQIKKLQRLGLELIEDVQALPYDELAMRLGKDSIAYLKRLEPQANPPLTRFSPPEYFSLSIGFDEEVHVSTALLFPIKRLLESLECFLRQRSFQVQSLSLMMFTRQKRIQNIEVFSAQAELLAEHWHKLLRLKLESTTLEAPVMGLALETGPFVQFEIEAQDFFQAPNHQRSIASTLSKL